MLEIRKLERVESWTELLCSVIAVHVHSILWFLMLLDLPNTPRSLVGPSVSLPFCIENTEPRNKL